MHSTAIEGKHMEKGTRPCATFAARGRKKGRPGIRAPLEALHALLLRGRLADLLLRWQTLYFVTQVTN